MATIYAANAPAQSPSIANGAMELDLAPTTNRKSARRVPEPISVEKPMDDPKTLPIMLSTDAQASPREDWPLPNPPFVFPSRPSSSSAPSSLSRATGRRPRSAVDSPQRSFDFGSNSLAVPESASQSRSATLPDFSFNPGAEEPSHGAQSEGSVPLPEFSFNPGGASSSEGSLLSPPMSPSSPRLIPGSASRRHQRGGSEFVGGNIRAGESITVMSTSPTKSEGGFAEPNLAPPDASNPRRRGPGGAGHRHRRSAAISSHDLSMILNPKSPTTSKGSSAPTTPSDFEDHSKPFPEEKVEIPVTVKLEESIPVTPIRDSARDNLGEAVPDVSPPRPTPRARVGFSDTLEFIPRPLSLVSTDTSSTVTTVRPSHSLSGSISSIVSLSAATPVSTAGRDSPSLLGSPVSSKKGTSRPSTAGAVLERVATVHTAAGEGSSSPRRRNSIPLLTGLIEAESSNAASPSPTKAPKRWTFFGFDSLAAGSPTKNLPSQNADYFDGAAEVLNVEGPSAEDASESLAEDADAQAEDTKAPSKKKKPKKVKSWAGSILTRKSKSRSHKNKSARRRSLTPPLPIGAPDDDAEDDVSDTAEPASAPVVMVTEPTSPPRELGLRPSRSHDDDTSYPMIDLDAALGPFNTPSSRDAAWDAAQRAGQTPKRQLHSAAGMRGFSGPGMHYHRRAESAPEMPPFEDPRFGIHRFGSSSTMADVFEEDEEEDVDGTGSKSPSEASSTPDASGTSFIEVDARSAITDTVSTPTREYSLSAQPSKDSFVPSNSIKRKGSGSSLDLQRPGSRKRADTSTNSLHEEVIVEEPIYQAADQARIYEPFPELSGPSASPRRIITNKELAPVEIHAAGLPVAAVLPTSPFSMAQTSPVPSPLSPVSFDARRVSTAPSSVTDENNFQSLLMGEPGPEVVRISVDIPSMTSSNSTATGESNFPSVRPRNMAFHEQRPASFTSTAFGRRRSSLASLSRLISSAHGERSKLSMEVTLDEAEKKPKAAKTKRFSKLKFWKSKPTADS